MPSTAWIKTALLAAIIAATGCGEDTDQVRSDCEVACEQFLVCAGQIGFNRLYDSPGACKAECRDSIQRADLDAGPQCGDAARAELSCIATLDCEQLLDWAEAEFQYPCRDEDEREAAACESYKGHRKTGFALRPAN